MSVAQAPVALSGLYYPNKLGRVLFVSLQEVLGENGLNTLLKMTGLQQYVGNFPPENLERQFDFAHFTALCAGLDDLFGKRGGRGLSLRVGRACFTEGLKNFGALVGMGDLAFKVLPLPMKLKMGLPALASVFTNFSDQKTTVQEFDDHYRYIMDPCPCCWKRTSDKPVCHVAVGVLTEGLRWVSGGQEFKVYEDKCRAVGEPRCECIIFKQPINTAG